MSAAVDVSLDDRDLRNAVALAFRAVDSVHDDGVLTRIPLTANLKLKSTLACYHFKGSRPIDIEINPRAPATAFNVLEEIAHFLDHQALGTQGFGFASKGDPALAPWRAAALKSVPVRNVLKAVVKAKGCLRTRLRVACATHEVFGRSYAQYIAMKSGDPILLAGLEADRNSGLGDILHWNDREFQAIMKAFDQLFADKHRI